MDIIAGWAELDKGNIEDGHYRRRPQFVCYAEQALADALSEHDRVITAFENNMASYAHMDAAGAVVNALSDYANHCRQCWHDGKDRPDESLGEFLVRWEVIKPENSASRVDIVKLHALETELLPVRGYSAETYIGSIGL